MDGLTNKVPTTISFWRRIFGKRKRMHGILTLQFTDEVSSIDTPKGLLFALIDGNKHNSESLHSIWLHHWNNYHGAYLSFDRSDGRWKFQLEDVNSSMKLRYDIAEFANADDDILNSAACEFAFEYLRIQRLQQSLVVAERIVLADRIKKTKQWLEDKCS